MKLLGIVAGFFLPLLFLFSAPLPERSDSAVVRFLRESYRVDFSCNNRIVPLMTGQEKFDDLFKAVRDARRTIHMEYFNFRNDSVSRALFDLLAQKVSEGVKVRVLFDGFGNASNNRPLRPRHLDAWRAKGIEIYEFDPLKFPYLNHAWHRDHRKIVVIDGMVAYTGGMNVADYYIKGKPEFGDWRDLHMRVEGDVAGELQAIFVGFWNQITGQSLQGPDLYPGEKDARSYFPDLKPDLDSTAGRKMAGVVDRVPRETPAIVRETFIKAIDCAQKQIRIINPYLTLSPSIRKSLERAAERGVDVQVMVSAKSDIPVTPRIVERRACQLMKAGAKVYFYEGGFHHSKIMMVDSLFTFAGSANLNSRSLRYDYECNLLIADVPTTMALIRMFEADKNSRCFMLTPERWKALPKWQRFKGWLFQILTPFVQNDRRAGKRLCEDGLKTYHIDML